MTPDDQQHPATPALPAERAFVVQLGADAAPARGKVSLREGPPMSRAHAIALVVAVGCLVSGGGASAAVVTSAADSGPGSLRETIAAAPAGDIVVIPALGQITLTSGQIVVGKNLQIAGPGPSSLTISAGGNSRIFSVSSGATVTISDVTLTDGEALDDFGGCIRNSGSLTLTRLVVTSCDAGSGGGVANLNPGTLVVNESLISENRALISTPSNGGGGGIFSAALTTTTVNTCTISGNSAERGGGGYLGGGQETTTFNNSTVVGNASIGSGGGLHGGFGTLRLHSTLVASNTSANLGPDVLGGPATSLGSNLIRNGAYSGLTDGVNGDQVGSNIFPVDPLLGPLADNGGPTPTYALGCISPAIDAGANTNAFTTDQRGLPRSVDGVADATPSAFPDVGAFELQTPCPIATTTTSSTTTTSTTTTTTTLPVCGDGIAELDEACDEGAANGAASSCCTADCMLRAAGDTCRPAAGACDAAELCTGADGACPADELAPAGTLCRPSGGACDVAETCDGASAACPDDAGVAASTGCTVNGIKNQPCAGGPGADEIRGTPGPDVIVGGGGDDELRGGDGDDLLCGEGGDDLLEGGEGADTLDGGPGADRILGERGDDVLAGGPDDDLMQGGVGADVASGGEGNDTISGGRGDDVLEGGPGDDVLSGGEDEDVILGGDGDDTISGGSYGDPLLDGGPGNDVIQGGKGDDVLVGGPGTDALDGGADDVAGDSCSDADQAGPFPNCEL